MRTRLMTTHVKKMKRRRKKSKLHEIQKRQGQTYYIKKNGQFYGLFYILWMVNILRFGYIYLN